MWRGGRVRPSPRVGMYDMSKTEDRESGAPTAAPRPTPYEMIGGKEKIRRIVDRFYDLIDMAPEFQRLRSMHARDLSPMRQSLSSYLGFWLGGPESWQPLKGGGCVMSLHARFLIDQDHAQQWIDAMSRAIDDEGVDPRISNAMKEAMARMCAGMISA